MFFKVVQDGVILDAWEEPTFVKYKERHHAFVVCDVSEADGVVLPSGSDIWLLEDSEVRIDGKEVARLVEITQEEFDTLTAQLEESGGGIKEPEPEQPEEPEPEPDDGGETGGDEEPPEEQPQEEVAMTRAEMTKAIRELQEQNAALQEQNAMLEECLMEMSELVYA